MKNLRQTHTFQIHSLTILLMALSSGGMYLAAMHHSTAWIWVLMGCFALANLLELAIQ